MHTVHSATASATVGSCSKVAVGVMMPEWDS
jgi:hypothetical protein